MRRIKRSGRRRKPVAGSSSSKVSVHFPSVPDLDDGHDTRGVIDFEEDPVVSHAETIEFVFALELRNTRRKDILL